ncbi:MAG: S9 family peptidase [Flavobacteriales bacterium]|nr:S9 family peptidase [Flavobacteriales bacterium]
MKIRKYIIVSVIFSLLFSPSFAQQNLTPEMLWKFNRIGGMDVSPDGASIVYDVATYDLEKNGGNKDLFLTDITGAKQTRITNNAGNEFAPQWRPDGKQIGFLAMSEDGVQWYEVQKDGTQERQVTHIQGGIQGCTYAPNQKFLAYKADVKTRKTTQDIYPDLPKADARIIDDMMYRHWDAWDDYANTHLFVIGYADGKTEGTAVDIMKDEPYDVTDISWSPDGRYIAYSCKKLQGKEFAVSTNTDIYLYDVQEKTTRNLTEGMPGYDNHPVFSPDGKSIAWLSMERAGFESDRNRIFITDLEGNKKELTKGFDQSATDLTWTKDGSALYFISGIKATYQIYKVAVKDAKITQITNGVHNYLHVLQAGNQMVASRQSMSMPTEIYAVNPADGKSTLISHVNDALLKQVKMGKVEERWVKTTDGKDMLVWVIYPPDFDKTKKYPALLYCQGGPQSAVSQFFSYRWNFQLMAANGYVIVAPNRRGLPSFGQEWNDQISGDWGGQNIQDYLSAIDAVSAEPFVDKDHLGAVGASYGGYSTYWLAGHHEKRFKAFVSHCGLFNMESWYGTTEEYFFANFDMKGAYWDSPKPKSYTSFSPHMFVQNWDTPILVIHGQRDFRVPVTQGMGAFHAAQLQGIPSRFLYYPDEGHWVLQPQNGILWHRVFFDWLDKYLK